MPDGHSTTGDQGRGARESIVAGSGRCMREPNDGPVDPCTGAPLAAAMLPIATTEAIRSPAAACTSRCAANPSSEDQERTQSRDTGYKHASKEQKLRIGIHSIKVFGTEKRRQVLLFACLWGRALKELQQ